MTNHSFHGNFCLQAVDEPEFSVAYARMCDVLQKKVVVSDDLENPDAAPKNIDFRKMMIARCQKEYERDYMEGLDKTKYEENMKAATTPEEQKKVKLQFQEQERRARRRSLGNIRFIGELYKLQMLTARIMHEIINKLVGSIDEESLECLCWLLTTIGKDLETETTNKFAATAAAGKKHPSVRIINNICLLVTLDKVSSLLTFLSRM
jgi:translation initiation factor 4G